MRRSHDPKEKRKSSRPARRGREAKHQLGTLAYSARLVSDVLQETVDEIAPNGVKKIILVNGHGGNNRIPA